MSITTLTPEKEGKGFTIKSEERTFFGQLQVLEMALGEMKELAERRDEATQSVTSEAIMELLEDIEIASDRITQILENKMTEAEAKPYYEELIK